MKPIFKSLSNYFEELLTGLGRFYQLFRDGRVHHYFLLFLLLVSLSAGLFLFVEAQHLSESIPDGYNNSLLNRVITVVYWSITTISTTGYGDIIPKTGIGRLLVIIILFLGIITVSLFTANLASAFTTRKILEGRGIMSLSKMKDHYVICGWKKSMGKFLEDIIKTNHTINLKKICIISNVEPNDIELFRQNYPEFHDVNIVRGDQYNENLLKKANIMNAAKILIFATENDSESSVGRDSISVLTAMTIRSISPDVNISAELIDMKFEKHLKSAHVDEIVYTSEYSSALMAYSFEQTGLTKVINDLLIHHSKNAYLKTAEIPVEFYEKPFCSLREYYRSNDDSLLIGLLENVGSLSDRKKEAIRLAQKTADVKILVDNLKSAKSIENNQSNLLPDDDYNVPNNALAILIWKKR